MNAVRLHYRVDGTGEPVIILHGLFGSSRNWQSMTKKLAGHYQVITADLRNHGQSSHADKMDFPAMAADVFSLAGKLELQPYSLIGHSLGGKVAMQMALTRPEVVARLAVLDIAPVAYRHRYGKIFAAMKALPVDEISNRQEAETRFCPAIGDTNLCRFLLQNLVRSEKGFSWRINLQALENNIETLAGFPELPDSCLFDGPCLFLGGSDSDFILSEHSPLIKKLFPAAEIRWLKQAGHMLHVEQPEAVLENIRAFLAT